jgi:transposase
VARQDLGAFLLRHGRHYDAGKNKWTKTYFGWLADQKFDSPVQQVVFQEYINAVEQTTDRVDQLTKHVHEAARASKQSKLIDALIAMRGVDVITATTIVAELGDITRFDSPRQLMAFLGLVPSENSTGKTRRQGGITKAGNGHVRKVLTEASWTYRHMARMTKHLKSKAKDASPQVQAIAWKAQKRLCGRYRALIERGKLKVVVCTAIARELCGFIWAIAWAVKLDTGSTVAEPSSDL